MMKFNRAGLCGHVLGLGFVAQPPRPADACGIKLTVKSSSPKKVAARSSNPSHVLLLGSPPRRLERELTSAGHDVEVAPTSATAKRKTYGIVVASDAQQAADARTRYPGAMVVVRSGDLTADVKLVENQVTRRPTRVDESRDVVAAREARRPVAAGPAQVKPREMITAKAPETAPAVTPPPVATPPVATPPVATVTTPPAATVPPPAVEKARPPAEPPTPPAVTQRRVASEPRPRTETKAEAPAASHRDEVYFSSASASVSRTAALARSVKWLTANVDAHVVIEGHADPRGTPEGNLALAQSRAESVRDHLVAAGIDASRIEVISYGDTRLKYGRNDPRNRRVAIEPKQ